MPCYEPLKAYRSSIRHEETGRYGITFNPHKALVEGSSLQLPCGQCTGCRLERSRQWAVRCLHESQLYEANCFITLTFSNEHLPEDYSIDVRHWQLFMKRLRKSSPQKVRFFACGEYGDLNLRPHYHAILFNKDYPDRQLYEIDRNTGQRLYTSPTLSKTWPYGLATLGDVTFESAAYVARYVMKKQTGDNVAVYLRQHPITKFWHFVRPEAAWQSRKPGLGAPWLERFKTDVYPSDFVIARGIKMNPPRFYDLQLTEEELTELKRRRKASGLKHRDNNTKDRLRVREAVTKARIGLLKRKL